MKNFYYFGAMKKLLRLLDILNFTIKVKKVVGDAGFEPATPWTQTKCATKLR